MALTSLDKENVQRLMQSLASLELNLSKEKDICKYSATSYGKLQMLMQQIEFLHKTANDLIENSKINKLLHDAECNFCKVNGQIYHFYVRENGNMFCSLIPNEWSTYFMFYGSYLFDYDNEFKKINT